MEALKCYSESSEDEHSSVSETGITKTGNHSPTKDKKATSYQPSHHDQPLTVERDQPIAKKEVHPEKQTVEKEHYHSQAITRDQPLASNIDQTDGDVAKEEEHRLESKGKHEHHTKERQQSSRRCAESYERKESTERHRRMSGHSSRKRQELGHHRKRSDSRSPERRHYSRRSPPRRHSHHKRKSRSRSRSPHQYRKSHSPVRHRSPAYQRHHSNRKTDSSIGSKQHGTSDLGEEPAKAEDNGSKNGKAQVSDAAMPSNKEPSAELSSKSADNSTQLTLEQQVERAIVAAQALAPKLPNYMNPGAMNPLKFQTIQEKRKLLWGSKKKEEQSRNKWESVSFEGEEGDKAQAKFRRLMGINPSSKALVESQKMETQPTILHSLQQQYDTSRYMTHIARGAGLGYGTDLQSREPFEQQSDKL